MSRNTTHFDHIYIPKIPDLSFTWTHNGYQLKYNIIAIDLIIALALKIMLMILAFGLLKTMLNSDYFSFMIDQHLYYGDMVNISKDPSLVFASDNNYLAYDTLYSRVLGFLAIPLWFIDNYIIAVILNILLSLIIAIFIIKIYYNLVKVNYINPRILFYISAMSPTFNAYSLLVLRDIMITCLFTIYIYFLLRNKWIGMLIVLAGFVLLRPFVGMLLALAAVFKYPANKILDYKYWWLWAFLIIITAIIFMNSIGLKNILWPIKYIFHGFDIKSILKLVGLGFIIKEKVGTGLSIGSGIIVRMLTTDSMLLPIIFYITIIPCFLKGTKDIRIFIIMLLFMNVIMGIVYLGALGSFPGRKILMLIPLFYIHIFYFINNHIINKKNKKIQSAGC